MSKIAGFRLLPLLLILVLAGVNLPPAAGQAAHSPRSEAQRRLALAADITFQKGAHAKLPPHLSTLLGIAKEEESAVMQSVVRTGTQVRGFDVSAANKKDVVLFVVDETANDQTLFLTSPEGTLRKVVSVKAGVGRVVRITEKDQTAFKREKQFWLDRLAPAGGAK